MCKRGHRALMPHIFFILNPLNLLNLLTGKCVMWTFIIFAAEGVEWRSTKMKIAIVTAPDLGTLPLYITIRLTTI